MLISRFDSAKLREETVSTKVPFIVISLLTLTAFCEMPAAGAQITQEELLSQIQDLRKIIEIQNQKISALENKVELSAKPIELKGPPADEISQHVERRLQDAKDGYQTIGGLKIGAGATTVFQQVLNANRNVDKKGSKSNDAAYSIDLEIEKEFDDWGRAFLHVETGDGLAGDRRTAVFSTVNRDADDSDHLLKLTEAYYEHYLFDQQMGIKVGQLDATIEMDQNMYAHDETIQFLSYMFRNSPVIDFPANHIGAHAYYAPLWASWAELSGGYLDGDNNGDHFFGSGFIFGQINFKPSFFGEDRPGNYRVYTWRNETNHAKWFDQEITGRPGYGFGLSADQKINRYLGAFGRYGWQDRHVYLLENAWSVGLRVEGILWHRDDDHVGAAFGQAFPGKNWRTQGDSLDPAVIRSADTEHHWEVYYSYKLNDHFTVSPNFQWIWNPYGMDTNPSSATDLADLTTIQADFTRSSVFVLGLRAQLDF